MIDQRNILFLGTIVVLLPAIILLMFNLNRSAKALCTGFLAMFLFYLSINLTALLLSSMNSELGWLFFFTSIRGVYVSIFVGIAFLFTLLV